MEKLTEEDLVIDIGERDRLGIEGENRVRQLREEIRYEYPILFSLCLFFVCFFPLTSLH